MKVKYTKVFTDEYGDTFCPGWVAEHTDAEGQRRIDLGVCVEVDQEARSRRQAPEVATSVECVPDAAQKAGIFGKTNK
jgi:hypothetical protein